MNSSVTGFEPVREYPNRFQVYRLNHSAKLTYIYIYIFIYLNNLNKYIYNLFK